MSIHFHPLSKCNDPISDYTNQLLNAIDPLGRVGVVTGPAVVSSFFDGSGNFTTLTNKTYASQFSYWVHGAARWLKLGNNMWEHTNFNGRWQPTEIGLGTSSADSSLLKLEYTYGVMSGSLDTTKNNGNIESQKITAPAPGGGTIVLTQSYLYDQVNRLSTA